MTSPAFDLSRLSLSDLDAELAERRFYDFVKASWRVLHPAQPFVDGWHIGAMAEHLEALVDGQIKNLLINIAVKMTKSIVASVDFPAWVWGPRRMPSTSWLYTSHSIKLASEHSLLCRRLIESHWYRHYWGDKFVLTSDQNEKMHFDNSMHGARAAFGLTAVTGHGGFFNICDDPHERDDWKRPNELKRNIDAYEANVYQAVTDPIEARRLVIGQRVADNDLSGHLVRQGGWDTLIIPTEYDPKRSKVTVIGWKDPRTEQGELACPARWGPKEVAVVKRATRLFMAFHQQSPTSDEGKIFPRNKWKYYKEDPREVVHRMETVIISVDCSFKDTPNSSMVAMLVIGKIGAYKFILDRRTDLMDMVATLRNLRALAQLWPQARAKIVEKYANGPAVVNQLRDEIPGMIEWPPEGQRKDSKIACAQVIQPEHESGNLCLPDPDVFPWVSEFVEICAAFPDGDYDDDVDALSQGVMRLDRTPTMAPPQGVGRNAAWLR